VWFGADLWGWGAGVMLVAGLACGFECVWACVWDGSVGCVGWARNVFWWWLRRREGGWKRSRGSEAFGR